MTQWTKDELTKIGSAEELQIGSGRRDGSLRKPVTVWVGPHDDNAGPILNSVLTPDARSAPIKLVPRSSS